MLAPKTVKHVTEPFATGGFSDVYKATFEGRPVAVKVLKTPTSMDPKKVHKVGFCSRGFKVIALTGHLAPRQRSGWLEVAPAREYPTIYWRHARTSSYLNRLHTDGQRKHHGLHLGQPETQPPVSCEHGKVFSLYQIDHSDSL